MSSATHGPTEARKSVPQTKDVLAVSPIGLTKIKAPIVLHVELDKLDDNPFQPRRELDETSLRELAFSIREHGLLQPITVCREGERFQIIAGHRRVAAARRLREEAKTDEERRRYAEILAHERVDVTERQKALFALVENLHREDLNALDAAAGLVKVRELSGLKTPKEVAEATGVKEDRVRRLFKLNEAPAVVKDAVGKGFMVELGDRERTGSQTDADKPRRERKHLELMSALEVVKLHRHYLAKTPTRANERTTKAIERFLQEGWHFRRIQEFVNRVLDGREADTTTAVTAPPEDRPVFKADAKQLLVHVSRLESMPSEQRTRLIDVLTALLEKLRSGVVAPATKPVGNVP